MNFTGLGLPENKWKRAVKVFPPNSFVLFRILRPVGSSEKLYFSFPLFVFI